MKKTKRFIITFLFFTVTTTFLNWLLFNNFSGSIVAGHIIGGLLFALTTIPIEKVYDKRFHKTTEHK